MNCIIIDDDKLSRKVIEEFILKTKTLSLINSFSNAIDAANSIIEIKEDIDLIFLDVEMPQMSGIEFLNNFKDHPQIIIISSKEKYALKSFELDVTDYLLKPPSYARFFKAITKAEKINEIVLNSINEGNKNITAMKNEIFIKKNSSLVKISYDDISCIEAMENYIVIITMNEKFTIHFTMKAIMEKLPANKFKRIHRSFIVNVNKIKSIGSNSLRVEKDKDNERTLPIGKSYKDDLLNDINLISK